MTIVEGVVAVLVGVGVGVVSALFGVGGGIVMVPFMVLALGFNQHVAEGTSLLVIIPTAAAGVLAHRRKRKIDWRSVLTIAAGGVIGAFLGAHVALATAAVVLRRAFSVLVAVVGARLLFQGLRASRQTEPES
ncbi:MAG TPA: sulfite exporter TauE/SafE family protein [Actinomycetota bacterium]|nr:sulfite exporter TauE/SafE family protein [Actinomycetota bacterium]